MKINIMLNAVKSRFFLSGKKLIFIFLIVHCTLKIEDCLCQWVPSDNGLPAHNNILYFAKDNTRLFAGTNNGLFVPQYDNYNWMFFYPNSSNSMVIMGNIFLMANDNSLNKSTDNGQTFSSNPNNGIHGKYIKCLYNIDGRIYAGTIGYGVYYSADQGDLWYSCNSGLSDTDVLCITGNSSVIYIGTENSGVYKSSNQGGSWNPVNNGLFNNKVQAIAMNGQYVYAGTGTGLFISSNGGDYWQFINNGITNQNIKCIYTEPGTVYAGSDSGIFISTNNGFNWNESSAGLTNKNINSITSFNNFLYAGNLNGTIYVSGNGGAGWQQIQNGLGRLETINNFAAYGSYVFAGSYDKGIWKSSDYGVTWSDANNGITPAYVSALAFNDNDLYAYVVNTGIIRSTNFGQSWQQLNNGIPVNTRVIDFSFEPGYLFCAIIDSGIFRSSNNGVSWYPANKGLTSRHVTNLAACGNYLFATAEFFGYGIFRSSDYGESWDSCRNGVLTNVYFDIIPDGNILYMITPIKTLYKTTNYGDNWVRVYNTIWESSYCNLTINGDDLIGSNRYSLWYSNNNGDNWYKKNQGFYFRDMGFGHTIISGQNILVSSYSTIYRRQYMEITGAKNISVTIPEICYLHQNYPNPFNPVTKIKFEIAQHTPYPLSRGENVSLKVFDVTGREIQTLVNEQLTPGTYEVTFDGSNYASGIYFYQLRTGEFTETKKFALIK